MAGLILPVCVVCGRVHREGMHGGIYVNGKFICLNCEAKICSLNTENIEYPQIVKKMALFSRDII